eukprot:CFRG1851T1
MVLTKKLLRKELNSMILSLSTVEKARQSLDVTEQVLQSSAYKTSRHVAVYLSTPEEIDTSLIIADIFKSGRVCYVPRYTMTEMHMLKCSSEAEIASMPLTKWNIRQPKDYDETLDAFHCRTLDMIIVPGMGFSVDGKRIGHGKGYYDKYITMCKKQVELSHVQTMGLGLSVQKRNDIPIDPHDVMIDCTVFPTDS